MPRARSKVDARKDPIGYLESYLVPKALRTLDRILSRQVSVDHPQFVRSLTIKRAASATIINGYVALKSLGIQNKNSDVLSQILARIKQHDLTRGDAARLEAMGHLPPPKLINGDVTPVPIEDAEAEETAD